MLVSQKTRQEGSQTSSQIDRHPDRQTDRQIDRLFCRCRVVTFPSCSRNVCAAVVSEGACFMAQSIRLARKPTPSTQGLP